MRKIDDGFKGKLRKLLDTYGKHTEQLIFPIDGSVSELHLSGSIQSAIDEYIKLNSRVVQRWRTIVLPRASSYVEILN